MSVTTDEIVALTGTELDNSVISSLISMAESEVTSFLNLSGITSYDSTDFDNAVRKIAVAHVIQRHKLDGTMPANLNIGGMSMSHDPDGAIKMLYDEARDILKRIMRKNAGIRQIIRKVNW